MINLDLLISFTWGFCIYPFLEVVWRGYSHPTMCFAGGICTCFIYALNKKYPEMNILKKSFFAALFITLTELLFGIIFNIILKYDVWDYSELPFNFMGQICLGYFVLWYIICMILIYLYRKTSRLLQL